MRKRFGEKVAVSEAEPIAFCIVKKKREEKWNLRSRNIF